MHAVVRLEDWRRWAFWGPGQGIQMHVTTLHVPLYLHTLQCSVVYIILGSSICGCQSLFQSQMGRAPRGWDEILYFSWEGRIPYTR